MNRQDNAIPTGQAKRDKQRNKDTAYLLLAFTTYHAVTLASFITGGAAI